ncbi:hypothetical protein L596_007443 [Steinernema carpocapsae]|uniref:CCHC-type domain-containing protein n=1 Tax=Steinernema carpocapsae TaxID=34508 RepID=A0A4V6A626_STECR|nr:hypothetical protein L596_007443 [Steinernema carpocapsae]
MSTTTKQAFFCKHSSVLQNKQSRFRSCNYFELNYQSQIEMAGFRCLHEGQRCRFFAYRTTKGLRAVKVTPLDSGQMGGELRPGREHFKNEKCYNCGRKGHKSKFCWEKAKDVCYYCKKPGHLSAECPKKQRKKEEKTFEKHEDEPVITSQEAKKEPLKKPKPPGRNSRKPQMSNSSRVSIPSKPIPLREVCRQMQKATIVAQAVMAVKASDSNPLLREQPKRSRSF